VFRLAVKVMSTFTKYALVSDIHAKSLYYSKLDSCAINRAARVVDFNETSDNLVWQKDIFVENRAHGRGALVKAAAGSYLRSL